jgi:uncharacterized damage-inducible protein DinB
MATSTTPQNSPAVQAFSRATQLLAVFERETAITQKVLRAYPADQAELRPHPRARTARELAWMFTRELGLVTLALKPDFKPPSAPPPAPDSWAEVVDAFERTRGEVLETLGRARDEDLAGMVPFMTGPKQMGEMSRAQIAWFLLHDQIHHRGQLTVYLRMAGGKVPSIYGPSADEPWN